MRVSVFIVVWSNKKIILIRKFRKHNCVNVTSDKIKYFDLYLYLDFSSFYFESSFMVFFHLLTHIILYLFDYICVYIF
jgi:hypothetical protein